MVEYLLIIFIQFNFCQQYMSQQNKKLSPQKYLEEKIRNIVNQASREKLLPKIIWNAAREFGSKKLLNYQKSVKKQYEQELKSPLKYDPESAKSDRQKFRDKVVRLMNNQLEIEYFENKKTRQKTTILYHGHQLQQCKVQTKKQYEMFKNFNEKRFKETYTNLFDDSLQLGYDQLYQNKAKKRCHTLHILQSKVAVSLKEQHKTEATQTLSRVRHQPTQFSLTKTPRKKQQLVQSARKRGAVIYFNQKKVVGSSIHHNQEESVIKIMKKIGNYQGNIHPRDLILTKESINKWLKGLYDKPNRIIDFLQINEVVNMQQFWGISRKLRLMHLDHILFMTFLYYDGNNDGYICDYDLDRLSSISNRRDILTHDFQRIKHSGLKKMLKCRENYLELYKLSEVSQSKYFEWKKKNQQAVIEPMTNSKGIQLQMKNRMLRSKQKHIFIDFPAFCSIYKLQYPFLWYDLIYNFSGSQFQGLRYD